MENEPIKIEMETENVDAPQTEEVVENTETEEKPEVAEKTVSPEKEEDTESLEKTYLGTVTKDGTKYIPSKEHNKVRVEKKSLREEVDKLKERLDQVTTAQRDVSQGEYKAKVSTAIEKLYPNMDRGMLKLVMNNISTSKEEDGDVETSVKKIEEFMTKENISTGDKRPLSFRGGDEVQVVEYDPEKGKTEDFWNRTTEDDRMQIFAKHPDALDQYLKVRKI